MDTIAIKELLKRALKQRLENDLCLTLSELEPQSQLFDTAAQLCEQGHHNLVSYSPKVFIPLTRLCRDVCRYCTFATTPNRVKSPYMDIEEVLKVARQGEVAGCHEVLFTLGELPELRYSEARQALDALECDTTLDYVFRCASAVLKETSLLPHVNPGCMDADELAKLRTVSPSMGMMLESTSERLCQKGGPHYGCPDKIPARRLEVLRLAGEAKIPFTSGILIGIGETRQERIESLLALRELHETYGHIQEVIVQNFRAKPNTGMSKQPEPELLDLLWTVAVARLILGPQMNIQVPPNLNSDHLAPLLTSGINDWGGVSPLTPDYVNPEAPWPAVRRLTEETASCGKQLVKRLTIYPHYALRPQQWVDSNLHKQLLPLMNCEGYAREDQWYAGANEPLPKLNLAPVSGETLPPSKKILLYPNWQRSVDRAMDGEELSETELCTLFQARGAAFEGICQAADELRERVNGDKVHYVVNRNINYTNVCNYHCRFCAFSKGKTSKEGRDKPYNLSLDEIRGRVVQAWQRGATEVCLQGGIHPEYTGQTYLDICRAIKKEVPNIHIHAFSPLEVFQGAATLSLSPVEFLSQLVEAGLGSMPGTAAEILDDEVREQLCPDKINTEQWLEVIKCAHSVGLKTTSTIMFGHCERIEHWARHLLRIRQLQKHYGGITEFVPLPFVHMDAPMYLRGQARRGPTLREVILMHAVARLALHPHITNIQTSWVKLGVEGVSMCLKAGANDLGGTLMNESITRAAGARHGQEFTPQKMETIIASLGRQAVQRTTLYQPVPVHQQKKSYQVSSLYLSQHGSSMSNNTFVSPNLQQVDTIAG